MNNSILQVMYIELEFKYQHLFIYKNINMEIINKIFF